MRLNINTTALVKHANKLEKLHRSALPVAVRQTLNAAAFDVKQKTMPASAKREFVHRRPNFFKANSKVQMAQGFKIDGMKAVVGFKASNSIANQAVENLKEQEDGGAIGGRSFIPTKEARLSSNWNRAVRARNRLGNIKNVINASKVRVTMKNTNERRIKDSVRSRNRKQQFVRAAIMAKKLYGQEAYVMGNVWGGGNQTLSRIDKVDINRGTGKIKIKRTPIYTFRPNRKITVARTNFMKRASLESGMSLERNFQNFAIKQLKKLK